MIGVLKPGDRGATRAPWLLSLHTFSFGDYYHPERMGFRSLRVINEDWIKGAKGFPEHSHRDMEIITYVLQGTLQHKDSMGNTSLIGPGEFQRMSAGTGIFHSEWNPGETDIHLLQIWILPQTHNLKPSYEQKKFADEMRQNKLCLVGSPDGAVGSFTIHQDVRLYSSFVDTETTLSHDLGPGRGAWVQAVSGPLVVNDKRVSEGSGVFLWEEAQIRIAGGGEKSEFLLFDLS